MTERPLCSCSKYPCMTGFDACIYCRVDEAIERKGINKDVRVILLAMLAVVSEELVRRRG